MSLDGLPANTPDEHYLEKLWDKLSLQFMNPQSDPVACAYMRLSFFIGANVAMGHYLRQENKNDRRQAREFMTAEIPKQMEAIQAWLKENVKP